MGVELERFKAFLAAYLCERLQKESLVYHGRSGHLVLPGLSNVFRVRAIADPEDRIDMTMQKTRLSRDKAKRYNELVDEDHRRWVRVLYQVNWDDPSQYDITINAARLTVENAASVLLHSAQLPEFQTTPASRRVMNDLLLAARRVMNDLLLAARCRLAIGKDERTRAVTVSTRADKGNVTVTYLPRQAREAEAIPRVLAAVAGIEKLICTMATTNILYLAEEFDPEAESLADLISVAEKWNAAIELVRLGPGAPTPEERTEEAPAPPPRRESDYDGGIVDDESPADQSESAGFGVPETMDRLIQAGRAGGFHTASGAGQDLVDSLRHGNKYSLVVVGKVFSEKGPAQKRLVRDLTSLLGEKFRVPAINADELKSHYLFGPRQLLSLLSSGAIAAAVYLAVFSWQEPILKFLSQGQTGGSLVAKACVAAAVVVFTPLVAFSLGSFYHNLSKLFRFE
jgi:hypothetical protein